MVALFDIVKAAAVVVAAVAVAQPDPNDTFDDKCKYLNQIGSGKKGQTAITAWCLDDSGTGKRWQTTINLNQCMGNDAGKLVWKDKYVFFPSFFSKKIDTEREEMLTWICSGNFDQTCGPCIIDPLSDGPPRNIAMKCNCLPSPNGVPKYTYLSMGPNST